MACFPYFEKVVIADYQLYPGRDEEPGLQAHFSKGPWILLGVNGLGKSTLLLILKHLLVGAVSLRGPGFTGSRSDLLPFDSRFFSHRVTDASKATATASVRFGGVTLHITRQLKDLRLTDAYRSDDSENHIVNEDQYRQVLADLMGLANFDDSVRALDRITFFLENRTSLIWDVSAQFEIFRALLTPTISEDLRKLEADIVSNDSTARNLNAALYKLVSKRDTEIVRTKTSAETQARLVQAIALLESLEQQELAAQTELASADEERIDRRIEVKRAERAVEDALQAYQQTKFQVLRHAFSGIEANEQYVLLKIIAERICPACGNEADGAAETLEDRRKKNLCLVCGSEKHSDGKVVSTTGVLQSQAEDRFRRLASRQKDLNSALERFNAALERHRKCEEKLDEVRRKTDESQKEVRRLRARLPTSDQNALAREETRIEGLRREVQNFRRDRELAEQKIEGLLKRLKRAAENHRTELEKNFHRRVRAFFGQEVRLVYSARKDRIGQGGKVFEFPAFEVEMTSGASSGNFIRRTADQVSLSQREYLDIVFRMSLLETFSDRGCSLVVDGPEGSLDALFADRAGELFDSFGHRRTTSNVILACNVVEGGFIPNTLRSFSTLAQRRERVINLIDIAIPTATLVGSTAEYKTKLASILRSGTR
ncbi:hypothetical protein WI560_32020 [Bradyrhizobium sp. A11]|uniref:hypothetical protein n=1 Tax=Bradyrhizobium sp. A11 TaxID=3133974 RepID=UPI003251C9DB